MNNSSLNSKGIASFILIASTLLEIKSLALLPKSITVEEDPHELLISQVEAYKKTKVLQRLLEDEYIKESLRHSKIKTEYIPDVKNINLDENPSTLVSIYEKLLSQYKLYHRDDKFEESLINYEEFTVSHYIEKIGLYLKERKSFNIIYGHQLSRS